ncbi:hypothetical protein DSM106972_049440 [Dulcicalothrix desertica PCC 7102]|uniref:Uncharacterized protein n=1 Tax=Dulcicalothrix desertica PCC 7102 TaxID=232991 RepID=A0A3S1AM45_9CYAN|nr:hypothetical protein [Dulcicalothrix desertica]RUT04030.1 hypothetical protein DSM106972_049440 [Dulcicalothrix desertica PCC 7102]
MPSQQEILTARYGNLSLQSKDQSHQCRHDARCDDKRSEALLDKAPSFIVSDFKYLTITPTKF